MATIKNLGVKMLALTLGMGKRRIFFKKKHGFQAQANLDYL